MVTFENVTKYFDKQVILRNITFSVEKGEMAFLTGPTGAGKSTLLKLMYRAERPDEGDITVGNFHLASMKMSEVPRLRRTIGVVFQDFKLIDNLTIFDNVALALRIRGMNEVEIKTTVFETLKRVYLRHLADGYPPRVSGGEQQRTVIARAIVARPQYLFADEPTGNLDPNTALDIMKLFQEINIQGTTVIIATHNRELYRYSGKRVIRLTGGAIAGEEIG
ncbi:MAG TPA: cell division ATP-binding protein FtsE [Dissulfurispiraceae bacterium]|nr:cell division ATP-binding protein FtsE [Dissulfurispiraceae bacterium]